MVLPLFQMLQYPEMDDSMGPQLRELTGMRNMIQASKIGGDLVLTGRHDGKDGADI